MAVNRLFTCISLEFQEKRISRVSVADAERDCGYKLGMVITTVRALAVGANRDQSDLLASNQPSPPGGIRLSLVV